MSTVFTRLPAITVSRRFAFGAAVCACATPCSPQPTNTNPPATAFIASLRVVMAILPYSSLRLQRSIGVSECPCNIVQARLDWHLAKPLGWCYESQCRQELAGADG